MSSKKHGGKKSAQTRMQVLDGAIRALIEAGVAGTTTRKIASAANVRLATLHYHFENKEMLLKAVLDKIIDEMVANHGEPLGEGIHSMDDALERMIRRSWDAAMRTRPLQVVHFELTLHSLREEDKGLAGSQYSAYMRLYQDRLFALPERLHRLSYDDCAVLARFVLAGIDGLILQELALPDKERSAKGIEVLIEATKQFSRFLHRKATDTAHVQ